MGSDSPLRRRRALLGLTQTKLADEAGVSRQLVVAAEAGVNAPSVDAALRLARALECSVEELFGQPSGEWSSVASSSIEARRRERVSTAPPRRARVPIEPGCLLVAGCDPALQIAERMLAGGGEASLLALDATTDEAIAALQSGGIHAAIAHGREGDLPRSQVPAMRMQFARWQVGLGISRSLAGRAASLEACLEQRVPIVQRQASAAAQQALRRAASALGLELPPGLTVSSHVDAATAAAALGCAGVTTEAAAHAAGLRFIPIELHTVELAIDRRWEQHPGVDSLGNLLTSRAFGVEVGRMGGYDLRGCGSLLATTEGER